MTSSRRCDLTIQKSHCCRKVVLQFCRIRVLLVPGQSAFALAHSVRVERRALRGYRTTRHLGWSFDDDHRIGCRPRRAVARAGI